MSLDKDDWMDFESWKSSKQSNFEERVVKEIIKRYGLNGQGVRKLCEDATGSPSYRWELFKEMYPTFPITIVPKVIPYVHTVSLNDLFNRFTSTLLYAGIADAIDDNIQKGTELESVAVVFNWPQVTGLTAIHNFLVNHDSSETRIVRRVNVFKRPVTFVIEKFSSLLDMLEGHWSWSPQDECY